MKTRKSIPLLCLVLTFLFTFSALSFASEIKDRMLQRLPVINELKAKGIVGENNMGYLEFRQASSAHQAMLNEENADRKAVYIAIAKKQGATPEFVGERRAMQIAEKADPGTWLQNETGQWYQK
jgi:hypothetical protein